MAEQRKKLKLQMKGKDVKSYLDPRIFQTEAVIQAGDSTTMTSTESGSPAGPSAHKRKRPRTSTPMKRCQVNKLPKLISCTREQSGKHPSKEMAKVCDADKSGESSDSSSDSEFNKNSNGVDTTASNQNCGTIESSETPENMESISESEKQKLNQEGCNDESEIMKLRKQNMDEQELFFAANGLPVPAEKGRLLVLIYFKVKNKNDINMNLLHQLAKELEVYYNPKVHTKEQLMAKVGDALFSKGIVKNIDDETVISRKKR